MPKDEITINSSQTNNHKLNQAKSGIPLGRVCNQWGVFTRYIILIGIGIFIGILLPKVTLTKSQFTSKDIPFFGGRITATIVEQSDNDWLVTGFHVHPKQLVSHQDLEYSGEPLTAEDLLLPLTTTSDPNASNDDSTLRNISTEDLQKSTQSAELSTKDFLDEDDHPDKLNNKN